MKIDTMLLHNSYEGYFKPKIKSPRPSQAKIQKYDIGAWRVFRKIALQPSEWRYKLRT